MRARTLILASAFLCCVHVASADEASDFEKARIAYVKKDYVEASARFEAMLDPKKGTLTTPELITAATFCYGAVKFAQEKKGEAHALWEKVILGTAGQWRPDPLQYSTSVLNEFLNQVDAENSAIKLQQARQAQEEAERRRREAEEKLKLVQHVKDLEALASEETVVSPHSRLAAMLPFGIGQFQNGKNTLGWFFLLTESAAMLTTFVLFGPYRYNLDQYYSVISDPQRSEPSQRADLANQYALVAQDIRTADFILLGAFGALALTGIIEAQINFVPERTFTRQRKLPPTKRVTLLPSFAPLPNGAEIGFFGRF